MADLDRVISFGPPKEAALYFERVLPLDQTLAVLDAGFSREGRPGPFAKISSLAIPTAGGEFDRDVLRSLLPDVEDPLELYSRYVFIHAPFLITTFLTAFKDNLDDYENNEGIEATRWLYKSNGFDLDKILSDIRNGTFDSAPLNEKIMSDTLKYVKETGFGKSPGWLTSINPKNKYNNGPAGRKSSALDYAIILRDLNLVDVTKVGWDAIVEFRKDEDSFANLRQFRAFFYEDFSGKDKQYVVDKIATLIYEQEKTSKFWGFETTRKSLSVAVSNQNIMGTSVGTLAPVLAGAPASVAAGLGALITVAGCAFEFVQLYVDEKKAALARPINYLTRLKKLK